MKEYFHFSTDIKSKKNSKANTTQSIIYTLYKHLRNRNKYNVLIYAKEKEKQNKRTSIKNGDNKKSECNATHDSFDLSDIDATNIRRRTLVLDIFII